MAVRKQEEADRQNDTCGYECIFIAMAGNGQKPCLAKYDLSSVNLLAVGGDGGSWVGTTFDLCGVKHIERILDPFHIKKAIRSAFGNDIELAPVYNNLFHGKFDATIDALQPLAKKGNLSTRRARRSCLKYLENHRDEILPLSERQLPFERLCSLGCMESNIGKTIG